MEFLLTQSVQKYLKKAKRANPQLLIKVKKQLAHFRDNPTHPSLRTHKLTGNVENVWSISIGENIRMLYTIVDDEAIFFLIGTHDEVYEK